MTRQDFELIAGVFRDTAPTAKSLTPVAQQFITLERQYLIGVMAARLREQNPAFDPDSFRRACWP